MPTSNIANFIVFAGTSTAQAAGTSQQPFPGGWVSDSGIQIWNRDVGACQTYAPGFNSNGDSTTPTWGLEAGYAKRFRQDHPNVPLYISKVTKPGSYLAAKASPSLPDWSPYSVGPNKLWGQLFDSTVAACSLLYSLGYKPMIDTMIFAAGEPDTLMQEDADVSLRNLEMIVRTLRTRWVMQDMRCVVPRCFSNSTQGAAFSTVRAAQETFGGYRRNAWVNADDLTSPPGDPGHLNPASVVTLGQRMYDADMAISP